MILGQFLKQPCC